MADININELTKEQIEKVMNCETPEELMAAAKAEGLELTREEAEAYMAELADFELDEATLKSAAGGSIARDAAQNKRAQKDSDGSFVW